MVLLIVTGVPGATSMPSFKDQCRASWYICGREFSESRVTRQLHWLVFVSAVLTCTALVGSVKDYQDDKARVIEAENDYRRLVNQVRVHSLAWVRVQRIPSVLQVLDRASVSLVPSIIDVRRVPVPTLASAGTKTAFLEALNTARFLGSEVKTASRKSVDVEKMFNGALEPASITHLYKLLFSLMGVLISCDAISGERVRQTLPIVLVHGVSRVSLVLGKVCGLSAVIALPVAVSVLCLTVLLAVLLPGEIGVEQVGTLLGIGAVLIVYCMVFVAWGVLASIIAGESQSASVLGISVWLLLVVAIPVTVTGMADVRYPHDKEEALQRRIEDLRTEHQASVIEEVRKVGQEIRGSSALGLLDGSYSYGTINLITGLSSDIRRIGAIVQRTWPLIEDFNKSQYRAEISFEGEVERWWSMRQLAALASPTGALSAAFGCVVGDLRGQLYWFDKVREKHEQLTSGLRARVGQLEYFTGVGRGAGTLGLNPNSLTLDDGGEADPTWADVDRLDLSYLPPPLIDEEPLESQLRRAIPFVSALFVHLALVLFIALYSAENWLRVEA